MTVISSTRIVDPAVYRRMGPRAAVLARRANVADCWSAGATLRKLLTPGFADEAPPIYPIGGNASAAEIALDVSRRAIAHASLDADDIDGVIYCHTVLDARLSDSTAGRLQHELGLKRANPFAISQAHHVATAIGLDLAIALIDGPERNRHVLLAASDTLLFEGLQGRSRSLMFAEVGAAAIVSREGTSGWRVEHVLLDQMHAAGQGLKQRRSEDEIPAIAEFCAGGLRRALQQAGIEAAEVDAAVAIGMGLEDAARVHGSAGIADVPTWRPQAARLGRFGASDLLLALADLESTTRAREVILEWSCGMNGEFACVLLTRH